MSFKLAQLLTQEEILSEDEMDAIFSRRQQEGDQGLTLDSDLCKAGVFTPKKANELMAQALGYPAIPFEQLQTSMTEALPNIPREDVIEFQAFPLEKTNDLLWIAAPLPLRKSNYKKLEDKLGQDLRISPISQIYFVQLLQHYYRITPPESTLPLIEEWKLAFGDDCIPIPEPAAAKEEAPQEKAAPEAKSADPLAGLGDTSDPLAGLGGSSDPLAGLGGISDPLGGLGDSSDPLGGLASSDSLTAASDPLGGLGLIDLGSGGDALGSLTDDLLSTKKSEPEPETKPATSALDGLGGMDPLADSLLPQVSAGDLLASISSDSLPAVTPAVTPKVETPSSPPPSAPTAVVDDLSNHTTLNQSQVEFLLGKAQTRDVLLELCMYFAASHLESAALFIVRKQKVVGRLILAEKPIRQIFELFQITLSPDTIFQVLQSSIVPYTGPVPSTKADQSFLALFDPPPKVVYFFPIRLRNRTVAYLYGHKTDKQISNDAYEKFIRLAHVMTQSLERVIVAFKKGVKEELSEISDILVSLRTGNVEALEEQLYQMGYEDESLFDEPEVFSHNSIEISGILASKLSRSTDSQPEAPAVEAKSETPDEAEEPVAEKAEEKEEASTETPSEEPEAFEETVGYTEGEDSEATEDAESSDESEESDESDESDDEEDSEASSEESDEDDEEDSDEASEEEASEGEQVTLSDAAHEETEPIPSSEQIAVSTAGSGLAFADEEEPTEQAQEASNDSEVTGTVDFGLPGAKGEEAVEKAEQADLSSETPDEAEAQAEEPKEKEEAPQHDTVIEEDGPKAPTAAELMASGQVIGGMVHSQPWGEIPGAEFSATSLEIEGITDDMMDHSMLDLGGTSGTPQHTIPEGPTLSLPEAPKELILRDLLVNFPELPPVPSEALEKAPLLLDIESEDNRQKTIEYLKGLSTTERVLALLSIFPGKLQRHHFDEITGKLKPELLSDPSGQLWEALLQHPDETLAGILPRLYQGDRTFRLMGLLLLHSLPCENILPFVFRFLFEKDPAISRLSASVLRKYQGTREYDDILQWLRGILENDSHPGLLRVIYILTAVRDEEILPVLIEYIPHDNPDIADTAHKALGDFTKAILPLHYKKWKKWWKKVGSRSHRVDWLLEGMQNLKSEFARSAIRELRELTGQNFEFDLDAPKSQRNAAIKKWKAWRKKNPTL